MGGGGGRGEGEGLAEWIAALEKLRARLISAIYRLAV